MQRAQDLLDPVFPAFLPGEVLLDELFQSDATDEVVQAPRGGDVPDEQDPLLVTAQRQVAKETPDAATARRPRRGVSARIDHVVSVFPRLGQMLTRKAGRLTGGERKMLAMGRVLMLQPAVFLLDEPTANLAPKVAAELLSGHVWALAEAGAAMLVVEQRAKAVLAISDCTYVLGGGQVLMADIPARLSASQEFTESFFGAVPQSPKLPGTPAWGPSTAPCPVGIPVGASPLASTSPGPSSPADHVGP